MSRIFTLLLAGLVSVTLLGCGGSNEPTNTVGDADDAAIQSYEDMVAADEAAMSEDPDDSTDE